MDKASTIVLILIAMVVCVAIGAFGFQRYQTSTCPNGSQTDQQLSGQNQQELDRLRVLKSSVVNLIMLYGQVTNISGNTITLSLDQSNLSFTLSPNANISFVDTGSSAQKQTAGQVSDIKTGENIQVGTQLTADNQLVGYSVLIVK